MSFVPRSQSFDTSPAPLSTVDSKKMAAPDREPFSLFSAMLWFFVAILLAFMIWMSVLIAQTSPSAATGASFGCVGEFVVANHVVAEPYSGPPASVTTNVTSAAVCQASCIANDDCLFFTYDRTNGNCYFYNGSTMPYQNNQAAVIGPSADVDGAVYVKNTGRLIQLRSVM